MHGTLGAYLLESTDGFMLRMKIADLDRKRNQKMCDVALKFASLIDYAKT